MGRRAEAKAATRAKVLATAKERFEALGYDDATIRDIAHAAGLSTGAVFANFSSKAEVYHELFGHDPISPEAGRDLLHALRTAESFMAGFEGDRLQVGIDEDLATMRAAIAKAEGLPSGKGDDVQRELPTAGASGCSRGSSPRPSTQGGEAR